MPDLNSEKKKKKLVFWVIFFGLIIFFGWLSLIKWELGTIKKTNESFLPNLNINFQEIKNNLSQIFDLFKKANTPVLSNEEIENLKEKIREKLNANININDDLNQNSSTNTKK